MTTLFSLMLVGASKSFNKTSLRKRHYILLAFGCMTIISMVRSYTVGRDLTAHYYQTFLRVLTMNWDKVFTLGYENGYLVFYKLVGLVTENPQWMIALHALFVIGVTGWFIYRNSDDVVLSTFLFITTNTWFMYMNILRQSMAVCFVLIGLELLKKEWRPRNLVFYYLLALLAVQFHHSAILALCFPIFMKLPFQRKHIAISLFLIVGSLVSYSMIYRFIDLLSYDKRDYGAFYAETEGALNITNLYFFFIFAFIFFLGVLVLVYYKRKTEEGYSDNFVLYMVLILVVCRLLSIKLSVISRMTYYFVPFSFLLLPRALKMMKNPNNRLVIRTFFYITMTTVFIWIGFTKAEVLYGTVPYVPFWR